MVAFGRGTYVQPHRHPEQWEMIVPMRGTLALLTFSDGGEIVTRTEITANVMLQVPTGVLHTIITVTPLALMLEIKPGPFRPAEFFNLFPSEGTPSTPRAVAWLTSAQIGDRWMG
jgi:cupin fold WbuC family metalloprotein